LIRQRGGGSLAASMMIKAVNPRILESQPLVYSPMIFLLLLTLRMMNISNGAVNP